MLFSSCRCIQWAEGHPERQNAFSTALNAFQGKIASPVDAFNFCPGDFPSHQAHRPIKKDAVSQVGLTHLRAPNSPNSPNAHLTHLTKLAHLRAPIHHAVTTSRGFCVGAQIVRIIGISISVTFNNGLISACTSWHSLSDALIIPARTVSAYTSFSSEYAFSSPTGTSVAYYLLRGIHLFLSS